MNSKTKQLIERVRKMIYEDYKNELEEYKNSEKLLNLVVHRMKIKEDNTIFHEEVKRYKEIFNLVDKILEKEEKENDDNRRTERPR